MSDKREYKKIFKKYKKQLNYLNKGAIKSPWEYSFGLSYFITFISFMKEYYDLGYNVHQAEENLTAVQKSLKETIDAYNKWQNFDWNQGDDIDKWNKEYEKRRNKFFKLLSENIEDWWD